MLAPFPDTARIDVPPSLALDLLKAAHKLPHYHNEEFYSPELQLHVHDNIREACCDGFDLLVGQIKERVGQNPYCALVQGLQFDDGNKLFVGLNRAFGQLVARPYEKPRAQLVHYVQPSSDLPSVRGGYESERLHTDTADWNPPVEMISMVCIRPDPSGGGHSRILDVDSLRDEVKTRLGIETLRVLEREAVPWQLASYCGGGIRWQPVLSESKLCWRRYTINLALDSESLTLSDEVLAALDGFERTVSESKQTVDFLMRAGECLFSDNLKTIHGRTPITNGAASERLMIRSWIRID